MFNRRPGPTTTSFTIKPAAPRASRDDIRQSRPIVDVSDLVENVFVLMLRDTRGAKAPALPNSSR
jgi:hypothetical protein